MVDVAVVESTPRGPFARRAPRGQDPLMPTRRYRSMGRSDAWRKVNTHCFVIPAKAGIHVPGRQRRWMLILAKVTILSRCQFLCVHTPQQHGARLFVRRGNTINCVVCDDPIDREPSPAQKATRRARWLSSEGAVVVHFAVESAPAIPARAGNVRPLSWRVDSSTRQPALARVAAHRFGKRVWMAWRMPGRSRPAMLSTSSRLPCSR